MGYAILRVQKLKSPAAVRRSMLHTYREQDTPNADPQRTRDNTHTGPSSVIEGLAAFGAAMPDKVRKNAVLAIEHLVTASPGDLAGKDRAAQDAYFADALDWLRDRYGASNVIAATVHRDETTPHLVAYVVPCDPDTGRLNCRRWLGGADALRQMQTDFAQRVGRKHGLARGIEHSRARHTTIREFYGALDQPEHKQVRVPAAIIEPKVTGRKWLGLVPTRETTEQVAARVTKGIQGYYAPAIEEAASARLARRKAEEYRTTAEAAQARAVDVEARLEVLADGLTPGQLTELANTAAELRRANQVKADQAKAEAGRQRARVEAMAERVALLARGAMQRAHEAAARYCRHALNAIRRAGGRWEGVNWEEQAKEWATKARAGQDEPRGPLSATEVATAVMDHSPHFAGTTPEERAAVLAKAGAADRADRERREQEERQRTVRSRMEPAEPPPPGPAAPSP